MSGIALAWWAIFDLSRVVWCSRMHIPDPDDSKAVERDGETDELTVRSPVIFVMMRREHPVAFVVRNTSVMSSSKTLEY